MNQLPTVEQLNHWCATHQLQLRFYGIARHSPRLVSEGFLPLDEQSLKLAKSIRTTLKADEWHALVDTEQSNLSDVMHYRVVRYSEMLALRDQGKMPTGLSATLLPFSQTTSSLLLQKRSVTSHLFPGFFSLLGGGFNPTVKFRNQTDQTLFANDVEGDSNNPRLTAQREVLEEAGLQITIPKDTLVAITQETDNGAFQINYLGVRAGFDGANADEEEGALVEIPIPRIEQVARLENFTDLAKANLAAWLMSKY